MQCAAVMTLFAWTRAPPHHRPLGCDESEVVSAIAQGASEVLASVPPTIIP
jgi:hypothetical protein